MATKQLEQVRSWMPMPGESASAYGAFTIYRDLGVGRTLSQVDRIAKDMPSGGMNYNSIREWATQFEWDRRILDYDAWMSRQRAQTEVAEMKKSAHRIEKARLERIDRNTVVVGTMLARALEMLEHPLYQKVREEKSVGKDGKTTIIQHIYEPTRWTPKDAAALIKGAMDIEKATVASESDSLGTDGTTLNAASSQIDSWRQDQAKKIQDIPLTPPGTLANPIDVSDEEQADDAA